MTRSHGHIPQAAILMIVGAVACFSVGDSIAKSLTSRYPIPLLVWARWGAQVLGMLIWLAPKMGTGMVRTRQLRMQLVRGVLLIASSLCFMSALRSMPLADATALNYLTPTLVIVLAILFLNERLTAYWTGAADSPWYIDARGDVSEAVARTRATHLVGLPGVEALCPGGVALPTSTSEDGRDVRLVAVPPGGCAARAH